MAAAFLVAQYDASEPWMESQRRRALVAVAHGPTDWTTTAAILALTAVALETPEALSDIRLFLLEYADHSLAEYRVLLNLFATSPFFFLLNNSLFLKSGTGYCCYRAPLVKCLLRLPDLRPEVIDQLQRFL